MSISDTFRSSQKNLKNRNLLANKIQEENTRKEIEQHFSEMVIKETGITDITEAWKAYKTMRMI